MKMKNDAMGGPFVSHMRVDRANARVVVVEGFVLDKFKGKEVSCEKSVLPDGSIVFDIMTSGIRQRYTFTEI